MYKIQINILFIKIWFNYYSIYHHQYVLLIIYNVLNIFYLKKQFKNYFKLIKFWINNYFLTIYYFDKLNDFKVNNYLN